MLWQHLGGRQIKSSWLPRPLSQSLEQRCPWLFASLAAAGCVLGVTLLGGTAFLEQRGYNLLHQLRSHLNPIAWDSRIAVVAIDEASLDEYGRFPWSRQRYAQLLDTLWAAQPAAVSFDILMSEATPQDGQLAQAITDSGNVVLAEGDDGYGNALTISETITAPAEGAFVTGHVKNWPDADGVSRRAGLYEADFPALSVATLDTYRSSLENTQRGRSPLAVNDLADLEVAPVPVSPVWLNWPGPVPQVGPPSASSLTVFSFADVAEDRVDLAALQNKIVLVGVTAAGFDPLRTPFHLDPPASGVYLHAAAVDNLLNQRFLNRMPGVYVGVLLLGVSGLTGYILYGRGARAQVFCCLGFPLVWLGLVYGGFTMQWWLPLAAPIGAVWLTAAGLQLQIQRDKQQLMNLFAMSVAPEMAHLIWHRKQEIFDRGELAAQELVATVLFMDIRGFTTIAEKLPSGDLLDWLNEYFEAMTDCIMAHGGVVDKYIGDAIMAVFGAPFPRTQPEQIQQDAIAAIQASLQMHQKLAELNQHFIDSQRPPVAFGIGIHTGALVAGTVGNRYRMNYSMFGDTVNVAARIEKMTKDLPKTAAHQILVSATTRGHIKNHFKTQMFCSTALRGRGAETLVYVVEPGIG
ncbi:MAG: adenylate/guanylate cyclase domain-containing protein [Cyanobacteria bacterium J06635_1]